MNAKEFLQQNGNTKSAIDYFSKMHIEIEMEKYAQHQSLNFLDWLMTNCELSKDQTIWSYQSEDYTLEGIYELYKINNAVEKHYEGK